MRRRLIVLTAVLAVALPLSAVARADTAAPGGGYNDLGCQPSAAHPHPVVLLHGLGGDPAQNFAYMGPALAAAGYCTFASPYSPPGQYPFYGLQPIDDGADDIARFIDEILAATGASQVSLVGHSEGGFMALYVPKVLGYGPKISHAVALAPPTHGTSFFSLVTLARLAGLGPATDAFLRDGGCGACADLIVSGPAVQRLNDGPVAVPGVAYTVIASRTDLLVRSDAYNPGTDTAFVREPGVRNLYVQDVCLLNPVGHTGLAFDPSVLDMVEQALDPQGAGPVRCSIGLPL